MNSPRKTESPDVHQARSTHALMRVLEGQRWRYGIALGAIVVGVCAEFIAPMVTQAVIDAVTWTVVPDHSGATAESWLSRVLGGHVWVVDHLGLCVLGMVMLAVVGALVQLVGGRQLALGCELSMSQLRSRLFDHIQRLPAAYHDAHETGELVQRCTSDVETVRRFLATDLAHGWRNVVMLAVVLPLMLSVSLRMTVVSLGLTLPILVFSSFFFRRVKQVFKGADEAEGRLTARLQETLTGIRVVRAFARQPHERERFDVVSRERRMWQLRLYNVMAIFWAASDFLGMLQLGLIVCCGAFWAWQGKLSLGTLFVFVLWAGKYIFPLRSLGRLLTEFGKSQVSMGRIMEVLATPVEGGRDPVEATSTHLSLLSGRMPSVEFRNVTFSYAVGAAPSLRDVSLRVAPGETVALLGPSGSGKSSLISLLLRFYEPQKGQILVEDVDIRNIPRLELRRLFGVALQEPYMFSRTVGANIQMGRGGADHEAIETAARVTAIHGSIRAFEDAYETIVGERGVTLSGGQRQRISLARAVLRDAPALILDDTLSAVDSETEQEIVGALGRMRKVTTLVVAHRFSTLRMADRAAVFEHGRIVQVGAHDELVVQEGLYRRLWDLQCRMEGDADVG